MKKSGFVWLMLLVCNCVFAQTIRVEADKKLDTDFSKFKTFAFSSQVDSKLDEGLYFLNDLIFKADVREAVEAELEGLGYQKTADSPDLIINFRVFDKPATLTTYESYGTTYWGTDEVREPEDVQQFDVDAGTLLVSLVDRESGQMVWQGFASGLIKDEAFIKDESKIKEAVNMIFEEYGIRANEYTRK